MQHLQRFHTFSRFQLGILQVAMYLECYCVLVCMWVCFHIYIYTHISIYIYIIYIIYIYIIYIIHIHTHIYIYNYVYVYVRIWWYLMRFDDIRWYLIIFIYIFVPGKPPWTSQYFKSNPCWLGDSWGDIYMIVLLFQSRCCKKGISILLRITFYHYINYILLKHIIRYWIIDISMDLTGWREKTTDNHWFLSWHMGMSQQP